MSSSVTLTITEAPTQELVLHLAPKDPPKPIPTRLSISTGLGKILIKFGKEQDPVSKNLIIAGREFLVYAVDHYTQPLDSVLKGTIEKIDGIKKVLQKPFSPFLFEEPWLVDGLVTLDKADLDEYAAYRMRFSGRPLEAAPHQFGQAVLGWLDALPTILRSPSPLLQLTNQSSQLCLPKDVQEYRRYTQYEHMLEIAHERKKKEAELAQTLARIEQLEIAKAILEKANTQGFERFQQDIARQEENQLKQNAEVKRGLVSLQAEQQQTVVLYQEANEITNAALRQVTEALDAAHIQMNGQQAQIHSLCAQLYSCQAQLGHLRNELNDAQSGCRLM